MIGARQNGIRVWQDWQMAWRGGCIWYESWMDAQRGQRVGGPWGGA